MATDAERSKVIAKIDAHRARRIGEMLVSRPATNEFEAEPELLVDFSTLDACAVFERVRQKRSNFATAPFDPEGRLLRFYPGGITLWSGFPGAGKTTLLRQFICHTLRRGSSVFFASLEEHPEEALCDLARTAKGEFEAQAEDLEWLVHEYGKRLRLWALINITRHVQLLATIRQLAQEGVRHAVIDSLMLLDVANDNFEEQRKFAALLAATAKTTEVHIHLVAHPRKLISTNQEPDLNDVAGARELGGVADNVLFVRRAASRIDYAHDSDFTPMAIKICKQRFFRGALGEIEGYYSRNFCQFVANTSEQPTRYLPDAAYELLPPTRDQA